MTFLDLMSNVTSVCVYSFDKWAASLMFAADISPGGRWPLHPGNRCSFSLTCPGMLQGYLASTSPTAFMTMSRRAKGADCHRGAHMHKRGNNCGWVVKQAVCEWVNDDIVKKALSSRKTRKSIYQLLKAFRLLLCHRLNAWNLQADEGHYFI